MVLPTDPRYMVVCAVLALTRHSDGVIVYGTFILLDFHVT